MRRGILVVGFFLAVALAGCGSSDSPSTRINVTRLEPHSLAAMRWAIRRAVDANLAELKAPAKTIACVDGNIEKMSARQIAERIVEAGPAEPRSVVEYLGPLGKGCP